MSNLEKSTASLSSSSSSSSLSSISVHEIDPLLKDLNEKKQSFRRNVVSLAAELKEVRSRLASQEQSYAKESLTRQACGFLSLGSFCILYLVWGLKSITFFFLWAFLLWVMDVCIKNLIWGSFLQEAEAKAKNMEEEIARLQSSLEERNGQLQASASTAEKVPLMSQFYH